MAGAGYRRWVAGEIIRASNVQPYLMDQVVQVFDNAAARSSATVSFVSEGMISTLKDDNKLYRYSGSAWLDIHNTAITTISASATATSANANTLLVATAAATVTIPDVLVVGERIDIERDTSGTVAIVAGTGVTSWAGNGTAGTGVTFLIEKQYGYVSVIKTAANAYRVIGRTTV
jgi:hypothetical protein